MITDFLKDELDNDYSMIADLGPNQNYLFPTDLATTDLRPDIVVFSQLRREVAILELTICCEQAYTSARERKTSAYLELATEVEQNRYNVELITLEFGSRGFVSTEGFLKLHDTFCISKRKWRELLQRVATAAVTGSYKIWTIRNHPPT